MNQSPFRIPPIADAAPGQAPQFFAKDSQNDDIAEMKRAGDLLYSLSQAKTAAPSLSTAKPPVAPPKVSATHQPQAAAAAQPAAGKKRKATQPSMTLEEEIAAYKQDLSEIEVDDMFVDMNCDQVRKRINAVLDGGIMKKGEFCNAIGSSSRSVNTFLGKRGHSGGMGTDSYTNAWAWFKQRELAGLKLPDVKKRQKAEAAAAAAAGPGEGPATKKAKTALNPTPDLSAIHLDGEESDSVPVFDTADEIRKKISAHLRTPGLTQAQFCRDLYAQLKVPTCKSIQTKQLNDFRGKKGPVAGVTSSVFYASYVLFEKLRLAKNKQKSAHRLMMEVIHPDGLDRKNDGRQG